METRLLLVLALLALLALGRALYRRWQHAVHTDAPDAPPLPARLLEGAERTWVLFTTPWCASCDAVARELTANDPSGRLVKIDATRDLDLTEAYRIRRAPTVLLADDQGEVRARLVGLEAVRGYVRNPFVL
ncbi:MAG TPA: thioredoxin family protein [Actinomycetota bacterium]|nr:thioredoxin family protein [Actinomycetota bacterium]